MGGQRNTSLMNILYMLGSVGTPLAGFLSWPVSVMFAQVSGYYGLGSVEGALATMTTETRETWNTSRGLTSILGQGNEI